MTNETQEQGREALYKQLVKGAQDLAMRVSVNKRTDHFENFVDEHNLLLERYIEGFDSMNTEEYQRVGYILGQTRQYIHSCLDVCRLREMRSTLEQSDANYQKQSRRSKK